MRFVRAYALGGFESVDGDGRTVRGRIVPYHEPADVVEPDDNGELVSYREKFTPASLAKMFQGAAARGGDWAFMRFTLDHANSLDHRIGYAATVESQDDGAWATLRLYDDHNLAKVQSMLTESHRGLSVEFVATGKRIDGEGVVERLGVHIAAVTATPTPMYAGAMVASVRGVDDEALAASVGTPHLDELRSYLANGCR